MVLLLTELATGVQQALHPNTLQVPRITWSTAAALKLLLPLLEILPALLRRPVQTSATVSASEHPAGASHHLQHGCYSEATTTRNTRHSTATTTAATSSLPRVLAESLPPSFVPSLVCSNARSLAQQMIRSFPLHMLCGGRPGWRLPTVSLYEASGAFGGPILDPVSTLT